MIHGISDDAVLNSVGLKSDCYFILTASERKSVSITNCLFHKHLIMITFRCYAFFHRKLRFEINTHKIHIHFIAALLQYTSILSNLIDI